MKRRALIVFLTLAMLCLLPGTALAAITINEGEVIDGGEFHEEVIHNGTIKGGTFNALVYNRGGASPAAGSSAVSSISAAP